VSVVDRQPLMTTREVATMLAVSPATVLRRWRAGELPGYRLGSNVLRFSAAEVEAWLEARRGQRSANPLRCLVVEVPRHPQVVGSRRLAHVASSSLN
jgi:excisionase family DNA binding protein